MVVFRRASCRGLDSMSALMVRRTGSLHDPEVRPMGATFRDLRGTHTGRIEKMRAVSDSISWLNGPSGFAQAATRRRSTRHMSGDTMTQLATSRPRRLIAAYPTRRLAVAPQMAVSTPRDHEARYVNAFTRLGRVLAVRPRIGRPMRLVRFLPTHSSTLLSLARTMDGSLLDHRAPSPGVCCNDFKSSHSLCR